MSIEKPTVLGKRGRTDQTEGTLKRARLDLPITSINKISQIDTRDIREGDLFLFDIDGTLIQEKDSTKQLLDKDTAKFIRLLQNKGALCIGFTSRNIDRIDETSKDLKKLGIDFSNVPLKSVKLPSHIEIDVSVGQQYQEGIIYTNMRALSVDFLYREKGGVLVKFFDVLKRDFGAGLKFREIVFVDDRQNELESVQDVASRIITAKKAKEFRLYKLDTSAAERRLEGKTKLYERKLYGLDEFPNNLSNLRCSGHSAEGSTGVFFLKDSQGNKYTFKCLSDPDLMKEEILADAIYASLGVPVPTFAIYDEKPDLSGVEQRCDTMGPYRVSKFIEADAAKTADKESVKTKIKQHFVIDAFMSNRDVAVGNFKNIIVDAAGTPYRIDNGGSLRYTSVGKVKQREKGYDIYKVTELDSLRDPAINQDGAQVYTLTRDEIDQQILDLLSKKDHIFSVVDELSTVLDIYDPEGLKNILVHRLKYLEEQKQGPSRIVGAYAEAQPGTSASVLIYTQIPASSEADSSVRASLDTYILLGKRVNHHPGKEDVWSNLGGKSDVGTGEDDQLLVDTASREVREESVGLITFTPLQLINCPSHDLIDKTQNLFHRMYIAPYPLINPKALKQRVDNAKDIYQQEYTDFAWVKVDSDFLAALETIGKEPFKIAITKSDGSKATIKLMENFGKMLAQIQVRNLLNQVKERRRIPRLHTRSVVGKETKTLAYKWKQSDDHWVRQYDDERKELALESPASIQDRERADSFIAQAQVRADSLKKIKEKSKKSPVEPAQPAAEIPSSYTFTQTEAFLSLELKGEFKQEEHEQNVDRFFAPVSAYVVDLREFSDILKAVYKNELKKKDWFVFYHAADPSVAFLWDLYTEFRNQLQYTHSTDVRALRGWDEFFKGIEDVSDFITASKIEKLGNDINNYAGDYQERGLAVNFALFGSYGNQTSSTYELFYDSKSVKPPNIEKLLGAFLVKVGAPFSFKNHIWAIKDKYFPDSTNGRLLQIFMNKKALDKVVYLSYPGGKLLSPSDNNANLKAQSMLELLRNKPKDFMNKITAKAIGDKDLQSLQARIFLKPEIMLNPEMVSITSYMRYPLRISKLYQKELKGAVKQLLSYVLEANAAAIDTFSTQQPLLSDYQRYYEMVTGKKLPKGEFATIMQIKKYIDSDDVEGLERLIDAHPKILNTLIPDLEYKYGSQGRLWMPFSYAINKHKVALVIALINKGKGFEAAILAAIEGMKHSAPYVRNAALSLWKVLFKKGQGFEKAIDEATKGIESPEYSVRESALDLWKALFEHRQGFDKATEVAKVGIKSRNDYVWKAVLSLWKALFKFEKDQSFEVALDAAKEGMKIPDYNVRMAALNLWEVLFEKCQGVEDRDFEKQVLNGAIDAATTGMKNLDNDVQSSSSSSLFLWDALLSLWKALVEKDQGFKGAILDASEGMNHPDNYVRMLAFSLWKSLFEKGEGFADAQECLNNMSDTNDFKKGFEQLINEYKSKFEQASLANIVPAASQPAVAAQVPAAK